MATARERRDEELKDWNSNWRGWDLGTLPAKAHREVEAIHGRYNQAVAAEKSRVDRANAAKKPLADAAKTRVSEMDKSRERREALKRLKERQAKGAGA